MAELKTTLASPFLVISRLARLAVGTLSVKHRFVIRESVARQQLPTHGASLVGGRTDCCQDMLRVVSSGGQNLKVFKAIVPLVMVNVMDVFIALQTPPKLLLHQMAVFVDLLMIDRYNFILHAPSLTYMADFSHVEGK
jgi:hypothetical protein